MRHILPVALATVWLSSSALANPAQELVQARQNFRESKYQHTVQLLSALLYPRLRLSDSGEIAEAHLLLGVAHFELGNKTPARREWEEALELDVNLSLDPLLFSETARREFSEQREEALHKRKEEEEKAKLAKERDRLKKILESMVVIEKRRYYINYIPFGAGQFQNGHRQKGYVLAVSQVVLGGTSVALYLAQGIQYGFVGGKVPPEEVGLVKQLQIAQITTGAAFWGLVVFGIIDSVSNYKATITRKPDASYLKRLEDQTKNKKEPESSFRLVPPSRGPWARPTVTPMVGPDQAGVALSWEF